ncbi:HD-GYP domain-containing protein [Desulfoscipio geothermicus]|uniref:HD domain-containing protein n=1 Tax=Desulfoscipio geothermicus DSM 3669 TaxID=1121426 RepID=A0A1I6E688_9FIRM|nr:HD-GYP domain-containing protein [Desulfoscipio geothermicus]SFR13018.1 HD domain-containing protein [Desulfoscipio geothermicus DSM 3669]
MRKVATDRLKPGMKIGISVFNANGQILLIAGTILTEKFIKRLAKLNVPAVYIDDGFLPDIEIDDVVTEKTRTQAIQVTKKLFQDFHFTRTLTGLEKIQDVISTIIDDLLNNHTIMLNLVDIRSTDEYTFGHSVNTCILSLITAIHMGFNHNILRRLAMGAIMHDLGKILVPSEILNKPGRLTAEEFEVIKKHSESGYKVLTRKRNFYTISALVALQHHERYDGSGYPNGLTGDEIHQFSAIVGLVDMYDALTADRVYRKAYSAYEAYEMISALGDYMFDFQVVESFLHHIAAYPVGTLVELNTGEIAAVVDNRPGFSMRPKIRVLFTPDIEPLKIPYEVDLASVTNITVVRIIDDDEELGALKRKVSQF